MPGGFRSEKRKGGGRENGREKQAIRWGGCRRKQRKDRREQRGERGREDGIQDPMDGKLEKTRATREAEERERVWAVFVIPRCRAGVEGACGRRGMEWYGVVWRRIRRQ